MDNDIAISLINLASALLIFFAAVIPIAYAIWRKSDNREAKSKFKAALFTVLTYSSLFAAFICIFWLHRPWLGMVFFFFHWSMWAYVFLAPEQPPTRIQILLLVVNTVLLGIYAVFATFETLLNALSISS